MNTISIIVPIYKTGPYLRKCVDSILAQSYKELEIILVDDGSPDDSGVICDSYARQDPRIKVIHKPNGGLSDARNAGLKIMTGQYVGFVDSDDWIEPTMYGSLLDLMLHYGADMAFGGVSDDLESDNIVKTTKVSNYGQTPFAEDKVAAMHRYFHGSWAAWDKLYRAELFDGIEYPVGEINEDEAIVLQLLDRCKCVCYTNDIFYHYMRREGEVTITSSTFSAKKLAWVQHCKDNLDYIRCKYPSLELDAATRYCGSLLWALTEIALSDEDYSQNIRWMKKQLKEERELFRRISFPRPTEHLRLFLLTNVPFSIYRTFIRLKRGR